MVINFENILLRLATEVDLESIAEIYNQGIDTKISTFDDEYVSAKRYKPYIKPALLGLAIVVAEYNELVIGWSSVEPISDRNAYRFTCLGSTYMRNEYRKLRIGHLLINEKFNIAKELGYHSIIGEILSVNEISLQVCYSLGYYLVGEIKEAGFRDNRWIGLTVIQKIL